MYGGRGVRIVTDLFMAHDLWQGPKKARRGGLVGAIALLVAAAPASAATTTLSMTVDPASPGKDATVSLTSTVSGNPQPALQVLSLAMPKDFVYRGDKIATVCNEADLVGYEPRCAESSLLGTGTATVEFKNGNVTGTAKVDPVRMYNAGPDAVLFHMKALPPIAKGVVVPSTVKLTDADFGPVFQVGPAEGANFGTLAITSFTFTSKPGVFTTGPCSTGSWVGAGRYLFLGGATQEVNPRIACGTASGPSGPSTGTASEATPGAALTLAGTTVAQSQRQALGAGRVRILSTRLKASGGKVAVRLQCRTAARCLGTLRIQNKRAAGGIAKFGTARFSIKGKASKTVTVKLRSRWGAALSRAKGSTWVRAHVDGQSRTTDAVKKLKLRR